ncbi:unnamed protein product [Zymoseptoria tritici ST99CH_3D1]|nr:unnamed protein product [Zymoseptoria tritici ST99CH_3D1]
MNLSIGYQEPAASPYWGPQTSAVNFCEEDYVITKYIAEFVNTLTSLAYIGYGLQGVYRHKRQSVGPLATVTLPYWGLMGIGIFSGLYHATMKYHTQMGDEMSMHLAMGCVLIRLFTFQRAPEVQRRNAATIAIGLSSFVIYHCLTDEFVLHVIIFFSLSLTVGWMTRGLVKSGSRPAVHKEKLSGLVTFATCNALFAYFLWNLDVNFCSTLTRWKHGVGMPLGILLELHGWWHMLTAVSCYTFMALIEFLTSTDDESSHALGFVWPAKAVLQQLGSDKRKT